ncbi:unnamed protein product [Calicophoron daubneyi]|uniref:Uncharacterized protein n=1 Tax=Calicophoron daubneyi TaxID=300641 RepID=A0AAV2TGJ4_CALDB
MGVWSCTLPRRTSVCNRRSDDRGIKPVSVCPSLATGTDSTICRFQKDPSECYIPADTLEGISNRLTTFDREMDTTNDASAGVESLRTATARMTMAEGLNGVLDGRDVAIMTKAHVNGDGRFGCTNEQENEYSELETCLKENNEPENSAEHEVLTEAERQPPALETEQMSGKLHSKLAAFEWAHSLFAQAAVNYDLSKEQPNSILDDHFARIWKKRAHSMMLEDKYEGIPPEKRKQHTRVHGSVQYDGERRMRTGRDHRPGDLFSSSDSLREWRSITGRNSYTLPVSVQAEPIRLEWRSQQEFYASTGANQAVSNPYSECTELISPGTRKKPMAGLVKHGQSAPRPVVYYHHHHHYHHYFHHWCHSREQNTQDSFSNQLPFHSFVANGTTHKCLLSEHDNSFRPSGGSWIDGDLPRRMWKDASGSENRPEKKDRADMNSTSSGLSQFGSVHSSSTFSTYQGCKKCWKMGFERDGHHRRCSSAPAVSVVIHSNPVTNSSRTRSPATRCSDNFEPSRAVQEVPRNSVDKSIPLVFGNSSPLICLPSTAEPHSGLVIVYTLPGYWLPNLLFVEQNSLTLGAYKRLTGTRSSSLKNVTQPKYSFEEAGAFCNATATVWSNKQKSRVKFSILSYGVEILTSERVHAHAVWVNLAWEFDPGVVYNELTEDSAQIPLWNGLVWGKIELD